MSAEVIQGKLSCAKKGIAFCKSQICSAATNFKAALTGSDYEECLAFEDDAGNNDDVDVDDGNYDSTGECSDDEFTNNCKTVPSSGNNVEVLGEEIPHCGTFSWKFPVEISQSTLDGQNGSSACSVIALIFAYGVWHERLHLQPTRSLSPLWVMLLFASIRVGNRLYDRCRHSLPQRFLSASEAATVAEQCVSVSVLSPLAVRVCDYHAPTTLVHQLSALCDGTHGNAALLIANEKTILFLPLAGQSIALVDSHRHGDHGAEILLGRQTTLDQFVGACQKVLDLNDDTYCNLSFIYF